MSVVLDASVALAWFLPDESGAYATRVRDQVHAQSGVAPRLWRYEVANGLVVAERRGRISAADADAATRMIDVIGIDDSSDDAPLDALRVLARRHQRTIYDAMYLELAIRLGLPLATIDGGMRQACVEAGIPLVEA